MQDKWRNTDLSVCLYWPEFLALYHSGLKWSPRSRPCMIFQFLTQIQSKVTNLENKLGMLEDGHSNTCKTVEGLIEDGLNALNTTVNEAKAARENLKWTVNRNVKSLRTNSCMQKFIQDVRICSSMASVKKEIDGVLSPR